MCTADQVISQPVEVLREPAPGVAARLSALEGAGWLVRLRRDADGVYAHASRPGQGTTFDAAGPTAEAALRALAQVIGAHLP